MFPVALEAVARSFTDAEARWKPEASKWSVLEVIKGVISLIVLLWIAVMTSRLLKQRIGLVDQRPVPAAAVLVGQQHQVARGVLPGGTA